MTAGVRLSAPNKSRLTPYATGVVGAELTRVSAQIGSAGDSASESRLVAGGGAGVEIHVNRHMGVFVDARILTDRHRAYYLRPSVGLYFRGR